MEGQEMTPEQILNAKGDELSRVLGKVLQPEGGEHELELIYDTISECRFCNAQVNEASIISMDALYEKKCIVFIPLNDWNVAMKWRDWAVAEYGVRYHTALIEVYMSDDAYVGFIGVADWLSLGSKPEHYLKAAALCKLKGKK